MRYLWLMRALCARRICVWEINQRRPFRFGGRSATVAYDRVCEEFKARIGIKGHARDAIHFWTAVARFGALWSKITKTQGRKVLCSKPCEWVFRAWWTCEKCLNESFERGLEAKTRKVGYISTKIENGWYGYTIWEKSMKSKKDGDGEIKRIQSKIQSWSWLIFKENHVNPGIVLKHEY